MEMYKVASDLSISSISMFSEKIKFTWGMMSIGSMTDCSWAGSGLRETFSLIRSASSDKHPGQHDVKQEDRVAWRIRSKTKQRSSSQTTGPQTQNKGRVNLKLRIGVCRTGLIWKVLNLSICLQTQSTLLQMTGPKAASKKEKAEPATDQQPGAPPLASNADDAENKR